MSRTSTCVFLPAVCLLGAALTAQVIQPPFTGVYGFTDLGVVPGVPTPLGGVVFKSNDPNRVLIGGSANNGAGAIYEIAVARDATGRITGFVGSATQYALAPNIDGGLQYGPGGVLFFTKYSNNEVGQIKPGSTAPDRTDSLAPFGVSGSVGALSFVPSGFPHAGELKLASYSGNTWWGFTTSPDGSGTYNLTVANGPLPVQGGPEGILFVPPGSALIPNNQYTLLTEYGAGAIAVYRLDAQGNPLIATRVPFMTGLGGAEGATTDPITGDLVFSTFGGGNHVITVQGFGVCGSFVNYGTGIAGTGGMPTIVGGGCAGRGQVASLTVQGRPGAFGMMMCGFQQLAIPLFGGFVLTENFASFFHSLDGTGQWILGAALPISPVLSGLEVNFQSFYLDAGATFGVSATDAVHMRIR